MVAILLGVSISFVLLGPTIQGTVPWPSQRLASGYHTLARPMLPRSAPDCVSDVYDRRNAEQRSVVWYVQQRVPSLGGPARRIPTDAYPCGDADSTGQGLQGATTVSGSTPGTRHKTSVPGKRGLHQ